jgi:hypothetical protein
MRQITLLLLLLVFFTTTAFSAELGAGKALKVDKGPTLEQTAEFIMAKAKEFYADSYQWRDVFGNYVPTGSVLHFIKFAGCNVSIKDETILVDSSHVEFMNIVEFNLADIINVKPDLVKDQVTSNGSPLVAVVLIENKPNISHTYQDYETKKIKTDKIDTTSISMKNKEYATRMANAFERAVQLCGGGKEIGKEELF